MRIKIYVASRAIASGGGAPSQQDRNDWWTLGQSGSYLGTLDSTVSYEIQAGDWYIVNDRVYLATAAAAAQTGINLSTGTGVIQLSVSASEFDLWVRHGHGRYRPSLKRQASSRCC